MPNVDPGPVTLDDLAGRNFATVPEAAKILRYDIRTVRSAIAAGDIPAVRAGRAFRIPVAWLRTAAGTTPEPGGELAQAAS